MQTKMNLLKGAGLCALASLSSLVATAQSVANSTPNEDSKKEKAVVLDEFVVTGQRAALDSAAEIKRDKLEIVDSIVASDINKLPDYNVTDALQRITGIQVQRDRGEGAQVTIRGLSQMENTLNGREIFTAGLSYTGAPARTIDFADIPAEMIAGINVYKSSSADHIEGGIGGLVEMYTRKPFDFKGLETAASVRLINGDLSKTTKAQYSVLASNRMKLAGGGELGALVNFTYQERAWREDQKGTGTPSARTDIISGQTVNVQNSTSESTVWGTRERIGVTGVLQWRPTDKLELYADVNYAKFNTLQDTHQVNVTGSNPVAGTAVLAPGTSDLQKITWGTASVSVLSFARDTHDWTKQFGAGAIWRGTDLTLKVDASYTDSYNDLYFVGPFFAAAGTNFVHDLSTEVPSTSVTGTNLTDTSLYEYTGIAYRVRPYKGDAFGISGDATYMLGRGIFKSLHGGFRYSVRNANNVNGLIFADNNFAAGSRPRATQYPNEVMSNPYGFFPNTSTPSIRNYMVGNLAGTRDAVAYRAKFGITAALPTTASPLSLYNIDETTAAAYVMTKFKAPNLPLDGNVGVRYVATEESLKGYKGTSAATALPYTQKSTYNNPLPSLNARYEINEGLYLRFSASKSLTRPNFNQLSPSLTLVPNPINPALNSGSAGNPDLKPIKATNYDVAIEKYFNKSTSVYATLFYKDVNGFVVSSGATETHDGQDYLVTRPRNADPAKIKGYELGYQQFFDFLPEAFRGFGVQANYTYIDSETPNSTLGGNTPLQGLSKTSYNLIGMYETKKFSARLAYNWRDKFLSGQANIANVGRLAFYTKDYGWMDASLAYRFNEKFSVTLEGTNLLRTKRISYYGVENRPQNVFINDRQIAFSAAYRF